MMVEAAVEKRVITLDDLLAWGEDVHIQIIDGEMVEMPGAGGLHHITGGNAFRVLDGYVHVRGIGVVFFDGMTFMMFSDPSSLRNSFEPDVSFIRNENVPPDWDMRKPHPGAPDLAVEIISPNDQMEDVVKKVHIYLEKGTQQVWLLLPELRQVQQYRRSDPTVVRVYSGAEAIDADELFPGIEGLTPDAIFAPPPWVKLDSEV